MSHVTLYSVHRNIHTKLRRSMTAAHLANEGYCYWNTRALEKAGIDTYKLCLN